MGLNYEKEGHVAKVGLNRPKERNALDPQILMDLHEAWKDINAMTRSASSSSIPVCRTSSVPGWTFGRPFPS